MLSYVVLHILFIGKLVGAVLATGTSLPKWPLHLRITTE
jgi:hypothetical protein